MSFLVGPLSGALVAGGVYYGFSNLMQTRTQQHIKDLHALSVRLVETPNLVQAPIPAASRIKPNHFSTELKSRWNDEVECLFRGFQNLDQSAIQWGKSLLYGPSKEEVTKQPSIPSTPSTSS